MPESTRLLVSLARSAERLRRLEDTKSSCAVWSEPPACGVELDGRVCSGSGGVSRATGVLDCCLLARDRVDTPSDVSERTDAFEDGKCNFVRLTVTFGK